MTSELSEGLLRFVIAGCFTQDYILPVSGPAQVNVLGGNLAYAAGRVEPVGENGWSYRQIGRGLSHALAGPVPLSWV